MLASLAVVFLAGLLLAVACARIGLPRIVGMLAAGVLVGPFVCNLLDQSLLDISTALREMALIVILIRAGLALDVADLRRVGRPAVLMSFLPALCETAGVVLLAPWLLGVSVIEAAIIGAVLGAVSPAVVVPRMVSLMEEGYGTDKGIPQLILAGVSLDDVFVIVLFTAFVGIAQGGTVSALDFAQIPVSIVLGVLVGAAVGWVAAWLLQREARCGRPVRTGIRTVIVLSLAFLLTALETWLEGTVPVSGLLAVMSMACVMHLRSADTACEGLSQSFGGLWLAAEVLLFVLVGAAVDIRYTLAAGPAAAALVLLALVFRSAGVLLCLVRTPLNGRERAFCVISYLPKATVQAAIGAVPLSLGLPCGRLVLSTAVLSILITAPLGAIGMDASYQKLLQRAPQSI